MSLSGAKGVCVRARILLPSARGRVGGERPGLVVVVVVVVLVLVLVVVVVVVVGTAVASKTSCHHPMGCSSSCYGGPTACCPARGRTREPCTAASLS